MKKVLIVSTVSRQFYLFERGNIEVLKSLGYEVHAAANFEDADERLQSLEIHKHPIEIQRSPFKIINIKAYKQLLNVIKSEKFDAVHCHSPMGGVIARLAAKKARVSSIIYTAHGFHFFKGASWKNWILYYPVEKFLSRFTDILITINQEDYNNAKNFKMKKLVYVPGIGIDTDVFSKLKTTKIIKRKELNLDNECTVFLSVGELIERKNHETALRAFAEIKKSNYIYLICGRGKLESKLKDLCIKLGIEKNVKFLGFRDDIAEICIASDVFIFPSYQEGLPVSVMEAMTANLAIIASSIRGNTDLIDHNKGGFLLEADNVQAFKKYITLMIDDKEERKRMGIYNKKKMKQFDQIHVKKIMEEIYNSIEEDVSI